MAPPIAHRTRPAAGAVSLLPVAALLLALGLAACENPSETTAPTLESPSVRTEASPASDGHTLLLLHFDGTLAGEAGEQPTQTSGVIFESGVQGSAVVVDGSDRLAYGSGGNFNPGAGTIEFWVKPRWNGNDHLNHVFFTVGSQLVLTKDAADNLRFIFRTDDSEAYKARWIGDWAASEWHHLAVTWTVPGVMRTYVDAVEVISHSSSAQDLITTIPAEMFVGSLNGDDQVDAVLDELRISDIARTPGEIAASYAAGTVLALAVKPITAEPYETWRQPAKLIATTTSGTREYPPGLAQWSSSAPEVATVDTDGVIRALTAGVTTVSAAIGAIRADLELRVKAPVLPPVVEQIQPFLATPAEGHQYEMPVVVLRYLPTADGVNLDVAVAPDFWELGPVSLAEMRQRLDLFDVRVKFMLEEGSRFRGYRNAAAPPSLGYRVIAYITVYEPTPPGKVVGETGGFPIYLPDYAQILERFGGRHFVEDLGVKEFWVWQTHFDAGQPSYDPEIHKPEVFRGLWESNMSSPVTGDISNSDRDPSDLPVYSRTYLVYGQNIRRLQNEAVHNHGHQLEAMLSHVNVLQDGNSTLFWQQFVGTLGRCGSTHSPPNTTEGYDYDNPTLVASDIADWTPAGTGQKAMVSADTWGTHAYTWPAGVGPTSVQEAYEPHWYIYWMQSMPGLGNTIPYGRKVMTNWWRFTGDWDGSIRSGLGLYGAPPAPSCTAAITPAVARTAVRGLADDVARLVRAEVLTRSQGHALGVKLDAASRLLAKDRLAPAANILQAFEHQVDALVRSGKVRPREVRTLRAGVSCLVRRMERS